MAERINNVEKRNKELFAVIKTLKDQEIKSIQLRQVIEEQRIREKEQEIAEREFLDS